VPQEPGDSAEYQRDPKEEAHENVIESREARCRGISSGPIIVGEKLFALSREGEDNPGRVSPVCHRISDFCGPIPVLNVNGCGHAKQASSCEYYGKRATH
jgi:hypothetical protein